MSTKDYLETRLWVQQNQGLPTELRAYFTALETRLRANNIWPTTTTTTSSTTSSTTSTTSSTTSSSTTSSTSTTTSSSTTTTA